MFFPSPKILFRTEQNMNLENSIESNLRYRSKLTKNLKTYLISPDTGNHERQNKALPLTPKKIEVLHRHKPSSRSMPTPSAKALLLRVSSSSRHNRFKCLLGDDGGATTEPGEERRRRRGRTNNKAQTKIV